MNIETLIQNITATIRHNLSKDYKIVLFGSWAKGNARETSDIDIGILGEKQIDWPVMLRIKDEIENFPTLRSIDVVDLKTKSEIFRNNVLSYAKAI